MKDKIKRKGEKAKKKEKNYYWDRWISETSFSFGLAMHKIGLHTQIHKVGRLTYTCNHSSTLEVKARESGFQGPLQLRSKFEATFLRGHLKKKLEDSQMINFSPTRKIERKNILKNINSNIFSRERSVLFNHISLQNYNLGNGFVHLGPASPCG